MAERAKMLGRLMVDAGYVEAERLQEALGRGRRPRERLGETLVRLGHATPEQVGRTLALQLGLPFVEPPLTVDPGVMELVGSDLVRSRRVLPLAATPRSLTVAMADPLDLTAVDELQFQSGRRVHAVVASPDAVDDGIASQYGQGFTDLLDALPQELRAEEAAPDRLAEETRRAPVVRLVDHLLRHAIDAGASDIHVEETGGDVRVRIRVDGLLRSSVELPAASRRAVLSRLKVIAGMDISVRRRAQDGRIRLEHDGRALTLRVSTLPVNGGEKAVVRVLDGSAAPRSLASLGMSPRDLAVLRALVSQGEGVVLAAGPTGSGKSTTLFAALSEVDREVHNVVTLEDPVEYDLPGANQVQVDVRAGLGFAEALRSILRQDPDVVMVGEIRDRETAEIAMAAAVTGHLVLSTIHTVDAPGAITRLVNMGVPPFLVAGGLSGVVAQRLVRKRCGLCRGAGCASCDRGCHGRTGVYQVLTMTDDLRDEVCREASGGTLRRLARDTGMGTLASDARRVLAWGLATPHEAARLIRSAAPPGTLCGACDGPAPSDALACPSCGARIGSLCGCGRRLDHGWRFCPWCVAPVAP